MNRVHSFAILAALVLALTGCAKQENLLKHQALCSVLGSEKMCQPDQEVALRAVGTNSSGALFETEASCAVSRDGQLLAPDVRIRPGVPGKFTVMKSLSPLYIICQGNSMYGAAVSKALVRTVYTPLTPLIETREAQSYDQGYFYADSTDVPVGPARLPGAAPLLAPPVPR